MATTNENLPTVEQLKSCGLEAQAKSITERLDLFKRVKLAYENYPCFPREAFYWGDVHSLVEEPQMVIPPRAALDAVEHAQAAVKFPHTGYITDSKLIDKGKEDRLHPTCAIVGWFDEGPHYFVIASWTGETSIDDWLIAHLGSVSQDTPTT